MKREIKFRAWDGSRMLSNVGTHPSMLMSLVGDPHYYDPYSDGAYIISNLFDSYTLMQFTGLKDKNGVEVYDGDIVQLHNESKHTKKEYWNPIYTVEWFRVGFRCLYAKKGGKSIDNINFHFENYSTEDIEVIGNIHQNPELI